MDTKNLTLTLKRMSGGDRDWVIVRDAYGCMAGCLMTGVFFQKGDARPGTVYSLVMAGERVVVEVKVIEPD